MSKNNWLIGASLKSTEHKTHAVHFKRKVTTTSLTEIENTHLKGWLVGIVSTVVSIEIDNPTPYQNFTYTHLQQVHLLTQMDRTMLPDARLA